jgi:hypothetical protein
MIGNVVAGITSTVGLAFPGNIAYAWYDGADTSTISLSGFSVTQWNDKGSAGLNLTQGTAANQPQSGTTTLNGKNVIAFDGADVLTNASYSNWKFLHDGTTTLIGLVVKVSTTADPNNDLYPFTTNRRAAADVAGRNLQAESRSTTNDRLRVYVSNATNANYAVIQDSADGVWDHDNPVVYTEIADPDNATAADRIKSYFGTGSAIATNTQTNAVSTANPTHPFAVGATDEAIQGITGYIAELVIVQGAQATESNRLLLRDYLKTKWGL